MCSAWWEKNFCTCNILQFSRERNPCWSTNAWTSQKLVFIHVFNQIHKDFIYISGCENNINPKNLCRMGLEPEFSYSGVLCGFLGLLSNKITKTMTHTSDLSNPFPAKQLPSKLLPCDVMKKSTK